MQTVSSTYTALRADINSVYEYGVYINDTWYGSDKIVSLRTYGSLYATTDGPGIGGTMAREFTLTLKDYGTIPKTAQIKPFVRIVNGNQTSEWLPKGVFYVDTRDADDVAGTITLRGFDIMLLLDSLPARMGFDWNNGYVTCKAYADAVMDALEDVGYQMPSYVGTVYDSLHVYTPSERTSVRQVMGWIAAAHGANWTVKDNGQFSIVPLPVNYSDTVIANESDEMIAVGGVLIGVADEYGRIAGRFNLGQSMESAGTIPAFPAISKVVLYGENDEAFSYGEETGYTLEARCGFANTNAWARIVLDVMGLGGYVYQPIEADNAFLDPAAELGDIVEINGTQTQAAIINTTFDALMTADVGSPGQRESEYPRLKILYGGNSGDGSLPQSMDYTDMKFAEGLQVKIVDTLPTDHASQNVLWVIQGTI